MTAHDEATRAAERMQDAYVLGDVVHQFHNDAMTVRAAYLALARPAPDADVTEIARRAWSDGVKALQAAHPEHDRYNMDDIAEHVIGKCAVALQAERVKPQPSEDVRETARELMRRLMLMTHEHHQRPFEMRAKERELDEYTIAAALQSDRDGPLISCPWCGLNLQGKITAAQISHLIDCGDAYRATSQSERDRAKPKNDKWGQTDAGAILLDGRTISEWRNRAAAAVAAETERCAKIAETTMPGFVGISHNIAAAIRRVPR